MLTRTLLALPPAPDLQDDREGASCDAGPLTIAGPRSGGTAAASSQELTESGETRGRGLTNGCGTRLLPPPLLSLTKTLGQPGTTDDSADDSEAAQLESRLGDRYCKDCEIQFKSFKTFKVRMPEARSNIDSRATCQRHARAAGRVARCEREVCTLFPQTPFQDLRSPSPRYTY